MADHVFSLPADLFDFAKVGGGALHLFSPSLGLGAQAGACGFLQTGTGVNGFFSALLLIVPACLLVGCAACRMLQQVLRRLRSSSDGARELRRECNLTVLMTER
jgi:hypothetical protein